MAPKDGTIEIGSDRRDAGSAETMHDFIADS